MEEEEETKENEERSKKLLSNRGIRRRRRRIKKRKKWPTHSQHLSWNETNETNEKNRRRRKVKKDEEEKGTSQGRLAVWSDDWSPVFLRSAVGMSRLNLSLPLAQHELAHPPAYKSPFYSLLTGETRPCKLTKTQAPLSTHASLGQHPPNGLENYYPSSVSWILAFRLKVLLIGRPRNMLNLQLPDVCSPPLLYNVEKPPYMHWTCTVLGTLDFVSIVSQVLCYPIRASRIRLSQDSEVAVFI